MFPPRPVQTMEQYKAAVARRDAGQGTLSDAVTIARGCQYPPEVPIKFSCGDGCKGCSECSQSPCEGCGKQCEVYGSSWCSSCHTLIPEYGKDRMCRMRNALINIAANSKGLIRRAATQALGSESETAGDANG